MTRTEFEKFICDTYGVSAEYPWERYPSYAVFRHSSNKKWFAVIMTVHKSRFGINEDGYIDIVNLKCANDIIDSFWQEEGIYPAYHMNKAHWLSVSIGESVPDDTLLWLLDISHKLTSKK